MKQILVLSVICLLATFGQRSARCEVDGIATISQPSDGAMIWAPHYSYATVEADSSHSIAIKGENANGEYWIGWYASLAIDNTGVGSSGYVRVYTDPWGNGTSDSTGPIATNQTSKDCYSGLHSASASTMIESCSPAPATANNGGAAVNFTVYYEG